MHITTQGLVLREVDYKESDKILTILTPDRGKVTVKARGCRRKGSRLAAASQLLAYSELTLFEYRDHFTMNEADPRQQFLNLRADLDKLALGSYFAETAEAAAEENVANPAMLSLVLNALYALDQLDRPLPLVKGAYELRLMCLSGYEPMLDACAVCGAAEPEGGQLHLREGVLHCAKCRAGVGEGVSLPVSRSTLAAMRHVVYGDPRKMVSFHLPPQDLEQFASVCESFLLTQLERGFRTLDFYKQISLMAR